MGIEKEKQYEQLKLDVGQGFTLEKYGNFIHPELDAYVTVATKIGDKWEERSYKADEWLKNVKIAPNTNSYNSVNTSFIPKRGNNYIRHLNAFFVDLDIYNVGIGKEHAKEQIDFLIKTGRIPIPTFIIDSGRGLYAIWKIDSVPGKFKNVQKLYNHIQGYLIQATAQIGSDPQASDMARVLRPPGTYNTKSNSIVKIMRFEDTVYAMRYLQEFMNDNTGYDQEVIDERNEKSKKKKRNKRNKKKRGSLKNLFNYYTLAIARKDDILKVCELRKNNVSGFRNTIIHIYAFQELLIEKNLHVARAKTVSLNGKFTEPLEKESIREVLKTVYKVYQNHLKDKEKGYNYKNETIINRLKITPTEQKEMKTLINSVEKQRRNTLNKRAYRRNKDGLTAKQRKVQERQMRVKELHNKGLNQTQIAKILGVGQSTIDRDLKV